MGGILIRHAHASVGMVPGNNFLCDQVIRLSKIASILHYEYHFFGSHPNLGILGEFLEAVVSYFIRHSK